MTPPLELCCMTVRQATLPELIAVAGDAGFDSLTATPFLVAKAGLPTADLRRRCDDAGVTIGYIDGLCSPLPGTPEGVTEERCFDMADTSNATLSPSGRLKPARRSRRFSAPVVRSA